MVIAKFATTTNFRPAKSIFDIFYIDFVFDRKKSCGEKTLDLI
jgi:hypothetical protein